MVSILDYDEQFFGSLFKLLTRCYLNLVDLQNTNFAKKISALFYIRNDLQQISFFVKLAD